MNESYFICTFRTEQVQVNSLVVPNLYDSFFLETQNEERTLLMLISSKQWK